MYLVFAVLLVLAAAAPAVADVTDRFTRTVPLGTAPVTLQVTIGRVDVESWDRPDLSVEIVRHAPDAQQLTRFVPTVATSAEGVVIRVIQTGDGRDAALRSDVILRVPAAVQLREVALFEGRLELSGVSGACSARVERGDITARGMSGTIRLETAMGDIRLERATLSPEGLIRVRTFNGDVTLELAARPVNARILALSLGGTITSDIPLTRQERWGPRWGEATLGTGEPVISIDVVNGDITIGVTK